MRRASSMMAMACALSIGAQTRTTWFGSDHHGNSDCSINKACDSHGGVATDAGESSVVSGSLGRPMPSLQCFVRSPDLSIDGGGYAPHYIPVDLKPIELRRLALHMLAPIRLTPSDPQCARSVPALLTPPAFTYTIHERVRT